VTSRTSNNEGIPLTCQARPEKIGFTKTRVISVVMEGFNSESLEKREQSESERGNPNVLLSIMRSFGK
jgi:hypothetical protein